MKIELGEIKPITDFGPCYEQIAENYYIFYFILLMKKEIGIEANDRGELICKTGEWLKRISIAKTKHGKTYCEWFLNALKYTRINADFIGFKAFANEIYQKETFPWIIIKVHVNAVQNPKILSKAICRKIAKSINNTFAVDIGALSEKFGF